MKEQQRELGELVSVIIPCYNISDSMEKLSSVFNQTYTNLELVLVDDCSKDDSWQKIQAFKQEHADKNIVICRNDTNLGAGPTRNRGFALSSGSAVYFMDADDELEPDLIEKMLYKLRQDQADFVHCGYSSHRGNTVRNYFIDTDLLDATDITELKKLAFQFNSAPWDKLVSRDFIERFGIEYPAVYSGQDQCWSIQLVLNARKISFINETLYHYQLSENSLSASRNEKKVQSIFDLLEFDYQYIKDHVQEPEVASALLSSWQMYGLDHILRLYERLAIPLQKQLALLSRDYFQQHGIDLKGQNLSFSYIFPVYRFVPKIQNFQKLRARLKYNNKLYSLMRKLSAIINIVELVTKEEEAKAKKAAKAAERQNSSKS